ncbi:MAG: DNA-directed DNA polymerase II small subunit [Methanobacteriaceae archaeon]
MEILYKLAKKNINITPRAYMKVKSLADPISFVSSLIVRIKSQNSNKNTSTRDLSRKSGKTKHKLLIVDEELVINLMKEEGLELNNNQVNTGNISNTNTNNININLNTNANTNTNNSNITNNGNLNRAARANTNGIDSNNNYENNSIAVNNGNNKSNNINDNNNNNNILSKDPNNENISNVKIERVEGTEAASVKVKNKFKRNDAINSNVNFDKFEIIQDTSQQSYTSGEIGNLVTYFQDRFEKIRNILSKRSDLKSYINISDIGESKDISLIGMVRDIRTTKNGHKIMEFEDETGEVTVLFHSDNHEVFKESEPVVKDEILGLVATKNKDLAIANKLVFPGVARVPEKPMDFSAVFTSDIHIGSLTFLEDAFKRFISWLNCDFGNESQMEIANDVKYLIVAGDIVDGIGIYPNQDKELAIKDVSEQYEEAARLLGDIRSDIKIIVAPGNHDASRVAEPQPAVPEKYAKSLYQLNNVEFVSNPAIVSLDGFKTLIYHGRSFDDIAMSVKGMAHEKSDLIMKSLLEKRHLAPIYGERTPLASELEDHLVIKEVPDIIHTGHVHINSYKQYKGVHMINSGTFQTQTEFQKIYNIVPTCAEVPVLNRGDFKVLKFI